MLNIVLVFTLISELGHISFVEISSGIGIQVVEISKGSKVKYELDKKTGLIKVSEKDLTCFC